MTPFRWLRSIVPLAALLLGCSDNTPPANAPSLHALSGSVVLTGYLVNESGQVVGNRVVTDADGVEVELLFGTQVVATTTTVDGKYRFTGLAPGGYRARARVIGTIQDQTVVLTLQDADLVSGDTLHLIAQGDLLPIPNPLVQSTTTIYFELPDTQFVMLRVVDVGGGHIRSYDGTRPPGINQVIWRGDDDDGNSVPGSLFWVIFDSLGDVRAHLLFR